MSDRLITNKSVFMISIIILFFSITGALYFYSGQLLLSNFRKSFSSHVSSQTNNIPHFYSQLAREKGDFSIIEYPVIIQDRFNPLYEYRSVHGKKIVYGYFQSHALKKEWKMPEFIKNNVLLAEVVFSRLESKILNLSEIARLLPRFIDLYDISSLKKCGAKFIVLHKNIKHEIITLNNDPELINELADGDNDKKIWQHSSRSTRHLKSYYRRYFGKPAYEDDVLIAVKID